MIFTINKILLGGQVLLGSCEKTRVRVTNNYIYPEIVPLRIRFFNSKMLKGFLEIQKYKGEVAATHFNCFPRSSVHVLYVFLRILAENVSTFLVSRLFI